jgi:hypothetical protein
MPEITPPGLPLTEGEEYGVGNTARGDRIFFEVVIRKLFCPRICEF